MHSLQDRTVNLLVTLDRNYLEPLTVMLASYGAQHRDCVTDVYVAHSSLEDGDLQRIEESVSAYAVRIHNIRITEGYFKNTPVLARLPEESFYRLLAFLYLPDTAERCLYLDPDIYIRKDLMSLYTMDLADRYIAGAGHLHGWGDRFNKARLGLKGQERYINSGVMLMNLKAIRRDFTLESVLECLEQNAQRLIMGDQDMVNLLFGHKAILLDERIYNLDERTLKYYKKHSGFNVSSAEARTAILHYNGKYKPWLKGYKGELDRFYPQTGAKGPAPTGMLKKQIRSVFRIARPTRQQTVLAGGIIFFLLLCLCSYLFFGKKMLSILSDPTVFRAWLDRFGAFDEAVFILLRAAQTVVKFIPAEPLEIASGYAWGAVPGMLYCVIGNMIGTVVILALTKRFGQKLIAFFLPAKNRKALLIFKNSEKIYGVLFFLYLIPGSPKDGFTYFAGMLPIRPVPFMIITGIARIPSVLSSTLCGAMLAERLYAVSALIFAATTGAAVLGGIAYHAYAKKKGSSGVCR